MEKYVNEKYKELSKEDRKNLIEKLNYEEQKWILSKLDDLLVESCKDYKKLKSELEIILGYINKEFAKKTRYADDVSEAEECIRILSEKNGFDNNKYLTTKFIKIINAEYEKPLIYPGCFKVSIINEIPYSIYKILRDSEEFKTYIIKLIKDYAESKKGKDLDLSAINLDDYTDFVFYGSKIFIHNKNEFEGSEFKELLEFLNNNEEIYEKLKNEEIESTESLLRKVNEEGVRYSYLHKNKSGTFDDILSNEESEKLNCILFPLFNKEYYRNYPTFNKFEKIIPKTKGIGAGCHVGLYRSGFVYMDELVFYYKNGLFDHMYIRNCGPKKKKYIQECVEKYIKENNL